MGFTIANLGSPVTKGTSGITVLTSSEIEQKEQTTCVRCGRCVTACPMRLVPAKLAQAVRAENRELLDSYHINACMECGSCAFVCPAGIPLVQLIRVGKVKKKVRNVIK